MKHRSIVLTILSAAVLTLSACGGEDAKKAAVDVKAAATAPKADPAAKGKGKGKAAAKGKAEEDKDGPHPMTIPNNYHYETRGRRDPFVNPVPKPVTAPPVVPVVRPDGLRGVLVAEAKVGGIVTSREPGMTRAILSAPGKKTFFASPGDFLFDAVIKEIRSDSVVFTMVSPTTRQPVGREQTVNTGDSGGTLAGEKK